MPITTTPEAPEAPETAAQIDYYALGQSVIAGATVGQIADLLTGMQDIIDSYGKGIGGMFLAALRYEVQDRGSNLDSLATGLLKDKGE